MSDGLLLRRPHRGGIDSDIAQQMIVELCQAVAAPVAWPAGQMADAGERPLDGLRHQPLLAPGGVPGHGPGEPPGFTEDLVEIGHPLLPLPRPPGPRP